MTACIFNNSSVSSNLKEKRQRWATLKYNTLNVAYDQMN